jgi:hypothetical protein
MKLQHPREESKLVNVFELVGPLRLQQRQIFSSNQTAAIPPRWPLSHSQWVLAQARWNGIIFHFPLRWSMQTQCLYFMKVWVRLLGPLHPLCLAWVSAQFMSKHSTEHSPAWAGINCLNASQKAIGLSPSCWLNKISLFIYLRYICCIRGIHCDNSK